MEVLHVLLSVGIFLSWESIKNNQGKLAHLLLSIIYFLI